VLLVTEDKMSRKFLPPFA